METIGSSPATPAGPITPGGMGVSLLNGPCSQERSSGALCSTSHVRNRLVFRDLAMPIQACQRGARSHRTSGMAQHRLLDGGGYFAARMRTVALGRQDEAEFRATPRRPCVGFGLVSAPASDGPRGAIAQTRAQVAGGAAAAAPRNATMD